MSHDRLRVWVLCLSVLLYPPALAAGLAAPADGGGTGQPPGSLTEAVRRLVTDASDSNAASDPPAGDVGPELAEWVKTNGESVRGVKPGPLKDLPWGRSTWRPGGGGKPGRLYLHVFDWHVGGKLVVHGLGGDVARAFLLADPQRKDLAVTKTDRAVIVAVPPAAPDPVNAVVVLEIDGEPKLVSTIVEQSADGSVVLHAKDVKVHGRTVRYEPEPHKNTVGYWMDPSDWVSWDFEVTKPGTFAVEILQGCGAGSGGSDVEFSVGGQALPVKVQDTGGFQNFVSLGIGKFTFAEPGRYTLRVKPKTKPGVAVMDLRSVMLKPVGG